MELLLMRHAIPVDPSHWEGQDSARPLTAEGRAQARAVILGLKPAVDAIWSSPYLRTQETAKIAAEVLGLTHETVPGLASGSSLIRTLPVSRGTPADWPTRLMCVGHQPDLGELVALLIGDRHGHYGFDRAGVARLTGDFTPGGMRLEWFKTSREAAS